MNVETPVSLKLNQVQASLYLGVSVRTLENWRLEHVGPPFYKLGGDWGRRGRVVYDSAELDAWLAARRVTSTSDKVPPP